MSNLKERLEQLQKLTQKEGRTPELARRVDALLRDWDTLSPAQRETEGHDILRADEPPPFIGG